MSDTVGQLWAVVGATGTGKSALSLDLAEHLESRGTTAHIVNCDAMQLYRGMDIGTAKIPAKERRGIPHHLFDELDVTEEASVAWYQPRARSIMTELLSNGAAVILVGGSGLYASSTIYDFSFPPRDPKLRARLEHEAERDGVEPLIERLESLAPDIASAVDRRNPRRVIRALELVLLGAPAQVTLPEQPTLWREPTRIIGVHTERARLVERLDERVENMWRAGILDEVEQLVSRGLREGKTASQAIGYAQALAQLDGTMTRDEAIAETQRLTRRYARRQVSWFKRYPQIEWINGPDLKQITL